MSAEQPRDLRITYAGTLTRLTEDAPAQGYPEVRDLPEMTLPEIAAAIRQHGNSIFDALAEHATAIERLTDQALTTPDVPATAIHAHLGLMYLASIRKYLLPLVLQDVQEKLDDNAALDRTEDSLSHHGRAGDYPELATELGGAV